MILLKRTPPDCVASLRQQGQGLQQAPGRPASDGAATESFADPFRLCPSVRLVRGAAFSGFGNFFRCLLYYLYYCT